MLSRAADWFFDRPLHLQAWIAVSILIPIILVF